MIVLYMQVILLVMDFLVVSPSLALAVSNLEILPSLQPLLMVKKSPLLGESDQVGGVGQRIDLLELSTLWNRLILCVIIRTL